MAVDEGVDAISGDEHRAADDAVDEGDHPAIDAGAFKVSGTRKVQSTKPTVNQKHKKMKPAASLQQLAPTYTSSGNFNIF